MGRGKFAKALMFVSGVNQIINVIGKWLNVWKDTLELRCFSSIS